jgi:tetratricopeptide (TPR) repeat protein
MIELEPDRLDELAALVAHHFKAGEETLEAARWSARAAHWAGHTRPQDAMRLWQQVTALVEELEESAETAALAVSSRLLQLEYAWRLGMDREEADALAAEATEIAQRAGDVHSLALLKLLANATPGRTEHSAEWIAAADEAIQLADEAGDPSLRIAVRSGSAYAYMCAGDLDNLERTADELLDLTGGDPTLGAGIVVDCPIAWGLMAKAVALRERDRPREAEELLDEALRLTGKHDDPEAEGWVRGSKSLLLADRGDSEAALALARRNRELVEQLGDVFSLSTALTSMAYVQIAAGEFEEALETVQLADRLYREAMDSGGETEAWRSTLHARALLGLGRDAEALDEIEWAARTAERRGMGWQIPSALHILAQARAATGAGGVEEALERAVKAAESRGHLMTQRRVEADRDSLLAAAG